MPHYIVNKFALNQEHRIFQQRQKSPGADVESQNDLELASKISKMQEAIEKCVFFDDPFFGVKKTAM